MNEKTQYQNIQIEFTNGKKVLATVPVFWDGIEPLRIAHIKITEALPLSEGTTWSEEDLAI